MRLLLDGASERHMLDRHQGWGCSKRRCILKRLFLIRFDGQHILFFHQIQERVGGDKAAYLFFICFSINGLLFESNAELM